MADFKLELPKGIPVHARAELVRAWAAGLDEVDAAFARANRQSKVENQKGC